MLHICQLLDKLNERRKSIIRSTLPIFGFPLNVGIGHVLENLPTMVTQVQNKVVNVNRGQTLPYLSHIYSFQQSVFLGKF